MRNQAEKEKGIRVLTILRIFVISFLGINLTHANNQFVIDDNFSRQYIDKLAQHYLDHSHQRTWQHYTSSHADQTLPGEKFDLSEGNATHWYVFKLVNPSDEDLNLFISLYNGTVDFVDFYAVDRNMSVIEEYHTGDNRPYEDRPIKGRYFTLPVRLKAGDQKSIYLSVKTKSLPLFPIQVSTQEYLVEYNSNMSLVSNLTYGAGLALLTYHLLIFFGIREKVYLFFALQSFSSLLIFSYLDGFLYFPLSNYPNFLNAVFFPIIYLSFIFGSLFYKSFYNLNSKQHRKFFKSYRALEIISIISVLLTPLFEFPVASSINLVLSTYASLLFLYTNLYFSLYKHQRDALLLLIGVLVPALANAMIIGDLFALSADQLTINAILRFSFIVQFVAFSIALSYRINRLKHEKINADIKAREAEYRIKSKSEFLATMSHEIRTPMNGVLGMSEVLSKTALTPIQKRYNDVIASSGRALLNIVNDLLDFSKIEAGKLNIESIPIDIRQLAKEVSNAFNFNAQEKGLRYLCYIASDVPMTFNSDPTRLRQIIDNYLSNALKFTRTGEIILKLEYTKENDGNKPYLDICVEDSGIGIPADKLDAIFDTYAQVNDAVQRRFGGTGLGLTICKQLSELMGGSAWAVSKNGKGSRFFFHVPIEPISPYTHKLQNLIKEQVNIYACEDSQACKLFSNFANQLGQKVKTASSKSEIDSLLQESAQQQCVLLMDLHEQSISSTMELSQELIDKYDFLKIRVLADISISEELAVNNNERLILICDHPYEIEGLLYLFGNDCLHNLGNKPSAGHYNANIDCKVLVVEDNNVNQMVLQGMLSKIGCQFDCAKTGKEALKFCNDSNSNYDLILMDCHMPVMDGYAASRAIREKEARTEGRSIPIIALSASVLEEDRQECFAAGMTDFLSKPVTIEQLTYLIQHYTNH